MLFQQSQGFKVGVICFQGMKDQGDLALQGFPQRFQAPCALADPIALGQFSQGTGKRALRRPDQGGGDTVDHGLRFPVAGPVLWQLGEAQAIQSLAGFMSDTVAA